MRGIRSGGFQPPGERQRNDTSPQRNRKLHELLHPVSSTAFRRLSMIPPEGGTSNNFTPQMQFLGKQVDVCVNPSRVTPLPALLRATYFRVAKRRQHVAAGVSPQKRRQKGISREAATAIVSAVAASRLKSATSKLALRACVVIAIVLTTGIVSAADDKAKLTAEFDNSIQPLLVRACGKCHGKKPRDNDLDLTRFGSAQTILARPKILSNVAERVRGGDMPPKDAPQLTQAEREQLLSWITAGLDAEATARAGDPGPVTLRRLSNTEYDNAIRDLTGVDMRPTQVSVKRCRSRPNWSSDTIRPLATLPRGPCFCRRVFGSRPLRIGRPGRRKR